jgi:membrane protein DedA with SNARE-associated domain
MDPLGILLPRIAASGIFGLLGVTLLERLVPILPSTALLIAMGVAIAEEHLSLSVAFWSSTVGSLLGSLSFYGLGLALGETRSFAVLHQSARFLGISEAQLGRLIASFRRHEGAVAFGSQLVPSVRLIAPGIAGLLRVDVRSFLIATTLGVSLWNSVFLALGYTAAIIDGAANPSAIAMKIGLIFLVGEGVAMGVWRAIVVWREHVRSAGFAMKS